MTVNPAEFRAWLAGRGDAVVGMAQEGSACPLARYLREQTGREHYVCLAEVVKYHRDRAARDAEGFAYIEATREPVEWEAAFIERTDLLKGSVSGVEALAILDAVLPVEVAAVSAEAVAA